MRRAPLAVALFFEYCVLEMDDIMESSGVGDISQFHHWKIHVEQDYCYKVE